MLNQFNPLENRTPTRWGARAATVLWLVIFGSTAAHAQAVVKTGEVTVKQSVYQILDKDLTKVSFSEGSTELIKESLAELADFAKVTRNEAQVDRYIVASWSDKNYPTKGEVSEGQRKLAERRSAHVKDALRAAGAENVDTFEMTKHPNWIQRVFSTDAAVIKNEGMNVTADERLLKEIGTRLRDKGGPRTTVIIAKFKREVLAR
jgi:hypothetical protein